MFSALNNTYVNIKSHNKRGNTDPEFFWFDEPGSYKFTLEVDADQQHLINFSIIEYASTGERTTTIGLFLSARFV